MTAQASRIEDGEHVLPVRVYYEDTDAAGIVYYANYLKYAERARTEMLRLMGVQQNALARDHGLAFAVRNCAIDYQRPAKLDDLLEVRSRLSALGGATAVAEQVISRDGAALVTLEVRLACIAQNGRPARIPGHLRAALTGYCRPTSAEEQS
ncbi:MAG: tol-pal system-associated acyl-CoA thioesterase [Pseudomonadota bacterium]